MRKNIEKVMGSFKVERKIVVGDPCYGGANCVELVVKPGIWEVLIRDDNEHRPGMRELLAKSVHATRIGQISYLDSFCVDSGHASMFDERALSTFEFDGKGGDKMVLGGCIAGTNFGDGLYEVWGRKHRGEIVALAIPLMPTYLLERETS